MKVKSESIVRLQKIIDSKIRVLIKDVFNQNPTGLVKKILACVRCREQGNDTIGVQDSHTIPKSQLLKIADSKKCVSMVGFTQAGTHESINVAAASATTYPLFCKECEKYFENATETVFYDIHTKSFIDSIMSSCERLVYKAYYKSECISKQLSPVWLQEIAGFKTLLIKQGLSAFQVDQVGDSIDASIRDLICHHDRILSADHGKSSLLSWIDRIKSGDQEELTAFVWLSSDICWRVGDLQIVLDASFKPRWFFLFSTKAIHNGVEKNALIYIPILFTGDLGSTSTQEDVQRTQSELLLIKDSFESFAHSFAESVAAISIGREDFWFNENEYAWLEKEVAKTGKQRSDGSSEIESLMWASLQNQGASVKSRLAGLGLKGFSKKCLRRFGGAAWFKSTGGSWISCDIKDQSKPPRK